MAKAAISTNCVIKIKSTLKNNFTQWFFLIALTPLNSSKFEGDSSGSSTNSELIKNIISDGKGKVAIPSKRVIMI